MAYGPVTFGIDEQIEIWPVRREQLTGLKSVKAKQPVGLIQPVLPQQRRLCVKGRQAGILINGYIGRIKYPFQAIILVECLSGVNKLIIRFRDGAYDHLGALPGGNKMRMIPAYGLSASDQVLPVWVILI